DVGGAERARGWLAGGCVQGASRRCRVQPVCASGFGAGGAGLPGGRAERVGDGGGAAECVVASGGDVRRGESALVCERRSGADGGGGGLDGRLDGGVAAGRRFDLAGVV